MPCVSSRYWNAIFSADSTAVAPLSEKNTWFSPGGRDLDQPPRQLGSGRVGRAEQRRVSKSAELFGDRGIDLRNAMPEQIAPQRRGAVEQAPAAIVDEVVTFGAHDDERLGREVLAHLGERMPHMVRIPPPDIVSAWWHRGQTPS